MRVPTTFTVPIKPETLQWLNLVNNRHRAMRPFRNRGPVVRERLEATRATARVEASHLEHCDSLARELARNV